MADTQRMNNLNAYSEGRRPAIKLTVECATHSVAEAIDSFEDIMRSICQCSYLTAAELRSANTKAKEFAELLGQYGAPDLPSSVRTKTRPRLTPPASFFLAVPKRNSPPLVAAPYR